MKEVFGRRFAELDAAKELITFFNDEANGSYVPNGEWHGWSTSVQNLLRAAFGEASPQYVNFIRAYEKCKGSGHQVMSMFHLFAGAKGDFDGGYVFDVELRVSGEVFGDFVALARQSLIEGHKDVAAVLACAALEDALKKYGAVNNVLVDGKTMSDVINALKGRGLVAGAQKSLLDAMPRIRNMALHGEWTKISEPDVASVLGFVEQFLLSKFSA